jgi:hypothetical protein
VDYRGATLDKSSGDLVEGTVVEVSGVQTQPRGALDANSVRVRSGTRAVSGENVQLEGVITHYSSSTEFEIDRQRVSLASAQRTDDSRLTPGQDARIEVAGTIDSAGVLQAARYSMKPAGIITYQGQLDVVDGNSGELGLLGTSLHVLATTQYRDRQSADRGFRLGGLAAGDYVEIRAWRSSSGATRINRVERRNPESSEPGLADSLLASPLPAPVTLAAAADTLTVVRGPVDHFDVLSGSMVVAGVTVRTNTVTTEFGDGSAVPSVGPVFFASLRPGDIVRVEGTEANEGIDATRIERQ